MKLYVLDTDMLSLWQHGPGAAKPQPSRRMYEEAFLS
jgi:hypothetical protein